MDADLPSAKKLVQFLTRWPDPVSEDNSFFGPSAQGTTRL